MIAGNKVWLSFGGKSTPVLGLRESVKKLDFLGDMSPIRKGGGADSPPSKRSTFFTQNVKNTHPCRSTGSKEIFIINKREKKKLIFFIWSLKGWGGGGPPTPSSVLLPPSKFLQYIFMFWKEKSLKWMIWRWISV